MGCQQSLNVQYQIQTLLELEMLKYGNMLQDQNKEKVAALRQQANAYTLSKAIPPKSSVSYSRRRVGRLIPVSLTPPKNTITLHDPSAQHHSPHTTTRSWDSTSVLMTLYATHEEPTVHNPRRTHCMNPLYTTHGTYHRTLTSVR